MSFSDPAKRAFRNLDRQTQARIVRFFDERIAGRMDDPRRLGDALTGPLSGLWRYRIGDYRAICEIRDREVTVHVVNLGNRRDIYR